MIGIRKEEENSVKYYGIRNRNAIINESDIDELMGYIVETRSLFNIIGGDAPPIDYATSK